MDTKTQQFVPPRKRGTYRQHSTEFMRAAEAKSLVEGTSGPRLALEFNININQVFTRQTVRRSAGRGGRIILYVTPGHGRELADSFRRECIARIERDIADRWLGSGAARRRRFHHNAGASAGALVAMIGMPSGPRSSLAAGITDMRAGMNCFTARVQSAFTENPYRGHGFVFHGRRGDIIKVLWWTGDGLCLLTKRLVKDRFVWPQATTGNVALSQVQLTMLLERIDCRRPART